MGGAVGASAKADVFCEAEARFCIRAAAPAAAPIFKKSRRSKDLFSFFRAIVFFRFSVSMKMAAEPLKPAAEKFF
jgi:hypothetical protein